MATPSPGPATPPRETFLDANGQPRLDAAGMALVERMEFVARSAVEGLLSGLHPSPFFGSSVEYADHRPYTPSDEIRSIDWKLVAKTDKYYVKLFEEQTNTRVTVILDTSRSMQFSGGTGMTKLDFGRFLAPHLLKAARTVIDPAWRTLDLIENTESIIHAMIRSANPGAAPPVLETVRQAPDELHLVYTSARRLCPLAIGLMRGMAKHYGEEIVIEEIGRAHV